MPHQPLDLYNDDAAIDCCNQSVINTAVDSIPFGGIAFIVASLAIKVFSQPLAAPLLGMGIGAIATKLVKNVIDWYDSKLLVDLTKEAHKLNKRFAHLQLIALIFAFAISFVFKPFGFVAGAFIGCFSATVFDMERAKLGQQDNRKHNLRMP